MKNILVISLLAVLYVQTAWAFSPTLYEKEPNDTPAEATPVSGEAVLAGMLSKGDQDAFMWRIDDTDSQYSWNMDLAGIPDATTRIDIIKVQFSKDAKGVEDYNLFFSFGTRTGTRPVTLKNLFFDQGNYLIAVTAKSNAPGPATDSATGSYQITLSRSGKAKRLPDAISRENALEVYPDEFIGFRSEKASAWLRLEIDEEAGGKLWTITGVTTTGHQLQVVLEDTNHNEIAQSLTNRLGKFTIRNLELDAGRYYLHFLTDTAGVNSGVHIYSSGKREIDEYEIEPNNDASSANLIDYRKTVHGTIEDRNDRDWFTFTLPAAFEGKSFTLKLSADSKNLNFRLMSKNQDTLQTKYADSDYTIHGLMLDPETEYLLLADGGEKGDEYTIAFSDIRDHSGTDEAEPDDDPGNAGAIQTGEPIRGIFSGEERDCFSFSIDRHNRLWSISAEGEKLDRLEMYKNKDRLFALDSPKDNRLAMENLFLLPGRYQACVRGKQGKYRLHVQEIPLSELHLGPQEDIEHEPNQDKSRTNPLRFGRTVRGVSQYEDDYDFFHFTLNNYEAIRVTAAPPQNGEIILRMKSDFVSLNIDSRKNGGKAVIEGIYPPGRYLLSLSSTKPSQQLYSLKLERLNFFELTDREPNDTPETASPMPRSFHLRGHVYTDADWYAFPDLAGEINITVVGTDIENSIEIFSGNKEKPIPLEWHDDSHSYTATLKSPSTSYLVVTREGFYDFHISLTGPEAAEPEELEFSLHTQCDTGKVAAHSESGQEVHLLVQVNNSGSGPLDLYSTSHLSDAAWKIETDFDNPLHLEPGEEKELSAVLRVPKNIPEVPVVATLKFSDKQGKFKTTSFEIVPSIRADVVNPYDDLGVPAAMAGGLNVARLDFGADRVIEHTETEPGYVPDIGRGYHLLFDNLVSDQTGFYLYESRKSEDETVTIKLMGDTPCEVRGVMLNPLTDCEKFDQLKKFSISLSQDGKEFTEVFHGLLGPEDKDQYFAFDKGYPAKYARLTLHNSYRNTTRERICLGEWKVIAAQESIGNMPPFNIADPRLGGHVVRSSKELSKYWDRAILMPEESSSYWDRTILISEEDMSPDTRISGSENFSWVLGFYHERLAKITDMVWTEPGRSTPEQYIRKVKILISTETPMGPWKEVTTWNKGEGPQSIYRFEKPVWARYLKFVPLAEVKKKKKSAVKNLAMPGILQVHEEMPGPDYRSILGEWGGSSHRAFYEYRRSPRPNENRSPVTGNQSRENALAIDMDQKLLGRVSVADHKEDWYRITVPGDHNQLTVSLSGTSGVDVTCELFDSKGSPVPPAGIKEEPTRHSYIFAVGEGDYYLQVKEPPISVIFAWDNSGSVSPYHTQIFDSVNDYVSNIEPGVDAVNLLCFGGPFLLYDFADNPDTVQTVFNNFDRDCDSSDAEQALHRSVEKLKLQKGIRGVIIIADAVGARDINLWDMLEEVQPKIFSIRVLSQYNDNEVYQGVMQSWSMINNGTYDTAYDSEGMYRAIHRASSILKRPVYYELTVQSRYQRPPGPGSLQILQPDKAKGMEEVRNDFAIELILDASGSMLQRIKGKRKIAIARDVLKKTVIDIIPQHTLVALRVFGHKETGSCRTDLEMGLQPLNPRKAVGIISRINAKNLAKTPIADSLAKVRDDLKQVQGKKVVILVTDGEETCGGDPAEVIQSLLTQGIDVRINIVGFSIDDPALKKKFQEWAMLGHGNYFDADDQKSLHAAISQALKIPFKVYDQDGVLVAGDTVGSSPVKLKAGVYRVVIESSPEKILRQVVVKSEENTTIILKDGAEQ